MVLGWSRLLAAALGAGMGMGRACERQPMGAEGMGGRRVLWTVGARDWERRGVWEGSWVVTGQAQRRGLLGLMTTLLGLMTTWVGLVRGQPVRVPMRVLIRVAVGAAKGIAVGVMVGMAMRVAVGVAVRVPIRALVGVPMRGSWMVPVRVTWGPAQAQRKGRRREKQKHLLTTPLVLATPLHPTTNLHPATPPALATPLVLATQPHLATPLHSITHPHLPLPLPPRHDLRLRRRGLRAMCMGTHARRWGRHWG